MDLINLAEMPLQPQIYQLGDRSLVLYQGTVNVKGQDLGKVYIVQDVTADQQALTSALEGLVVQGHFISISYQCVNLDCNGGLPRINRR